MPAVVVDAVAVEAAEKRKAELRAKRRAGRKAKKQQEQGN